MFELNKTFKLDPRLDADTYYLKTIGTVQVRLMNDKRWPWMILVPTGAEAADLDDLSYPQVEELMTLASYVSNSLKQLPNVDSTNVATLSNIVTQFHLHVVGRSQGDLNWPNPVWGFGEREPYTRKEADEFIASYHEAWAAAVPTLRRFTST